jgi:hypothetical protein
LLQLANLLGVQHPKSLIKVEFTRFMAQPFMQLHSKWMKVSQDSWGCVGPHHVIL